MLLIALSAALQLPTNDYYGAIIFVIAIILGIYQFGMSILLMIKLKRVRLIKVYLYCTVGYFLFIVILPLSNIDISNGLYLELILWMPWVLAVFFVIATEDLLWIRNKKKNAEKEVLN
ncbi:hypothetical protein [Ekhidna sp.]